MPALPPKIQTPSLGCPQPTLPYLILGPGLSNFARTLFLVTKSAARTLWSWSPSPSPSISASVERPSNWPKRNGLANFQLPLDNRPSPLSHDNTSTSTFWICSTSCLSARRITSRHTTSHLPDSDTSFLVLYLDAARHRTATGPIRPVLRGLDSPDVFTHATPSSFRSSASHDDLGSRDSPSTGSNALAAHRRSKTPAASNCSVPELLRYCNEPATVPGFHTFVHPWHRHLILEKPHVLRPRRP